jgi:putative proteasome-type protease
MTYCCGILVRDGLVMFADTRTNAGVDNISTFRKLHVFTEAGKRIMAIASAGNLSISQAVVSMLREGWENPETGDTETSTNAPTLFQAAQRVGRTIRHLHEMDSHALASVEVKFDVSFLLGGQIKGERPRLFMLYAAGNFIECTQDTPIFRLASINTASRCSTAPSPTTSTYMTLSRSDSSRSIPPCVRISAWGCRSTC